MIIRAVIVVVNMKSAESFRAQRADCFIRFLADKSRVT
jgi:hypothetical protein